MQGSARFPTTTWTLVNTAGGKPDARAAEALASLCERYWYPLYAYVRRRGFSPEQAQDLTQDFFARVLEMRHIGRADQDRGRFRSFLLTSLNNFLNDDADRQRALKRGGARPPLPFEIRSGEELYQREPHHNETPERIFERRWALALLDRVMARLRREYAEPDRQSHFDHLQGYLLGSNEVPYAALAQQLGSTEGSLKVAVHRLRKRYRDLLRLEIAETVDTEDAIDEEIRFLAAALITQSRNQV